MWWQVRFSVASAVRPAALEHVLQAPPPGTPPNFMQHQPLLQWTAVACTWMSALLSKTGCMR
jgi:hypothetical protein